MHFQRHLLAGTDRRSVLSFLLRGKRKACVLPDNKFLRNLHSSRWWKNGGIRGQGYRTCSLWVDIITYSMGWWRLKRNWALYIRRHTPLIERRMIKSERICPGIFFSLFIYRISCVKNICEICSAIHTKIKFHVKIL